MAGPSAIVGTVRLQFDPNQLIVGKNTDIRNQLSAVAVSGQQLFLACDEGCQLEALSLVSGTTNTFSGHKVFPLDTVLSLPAASSEEADIEGMQVEDGWLWLVGSHSVKRKKPKSDVPAEIAARLLETARDGNRHILARVPIANGSPQRSVGGREAAALAATTTSSALLDAIRGASDPHLSKFLDLPGKDNGFDLEGLAVQGTRVWVGMRGPVLREWCCILELHLEADGSRLQLRSAGDSSYRKHFLKLGGFGIRDLVLAGDDLLILAGPTMAHDGPSGVWRWKGGAKDGASANPADITQLVVLPQHDGVDRAEGLAVVDDGHGSANLLVVFDAPSDQRKPDSSSVLGDLYRL